MTPSQGILVVTSCTSLKASTLDGEPMAAADLYRGEQHRRLMRGIRVYEGSDSAWGPLDLRIVSAGHGLLGAQDEVSSYDETFADRPRSDVLARGRAMQLPEQVKALLEAPRRFTLLLLGDLYLLASGLYAPVAFGSPTLAFGSPRSVEKMSRHPALSSVALHNNEARRFSCGLVGLKGELGARVLQRLSVSPNDAPPARADQVLPWLDDGSSFRRGQLTLSGAA